jgi:predicted RNA-binding protein with RPS1 domain
MHWLGAVRQDEEETLQQRQEAEAKELQSRHTQQFQALRSRFQADTNGVQKSAEATDENA